MTMSALANFAREVFGMVRLNDKPRPEPEPFRRKQRPMVGVLSQLSKKQKAAILSYDGPENHGDPAFRLRDKKC